MHEHARLREVVGEHAREDRLAASRAAQASSVRARWRATYQSGNKSSSRRSSASSYGGSTPSRELRWKRTSASSASRYSACALPSLEAREVRRRAQVLQQEKAAVEVLREHFRRVNAGTRAAGRRLARTERQFSIGGGASIAISVACGGRGRMRVLASVDAGNSGESSRPRRPGRAEGDRRTSDVARAIRRAQAERGSAADTSIGVEKVGASRRAALECAAF